jgi:hypothetical protein
VILQWKAKSDIYRFHNVHIEPHKYNPQNSIVPPRYDNNSDNSAIFFSSLRCVRACRKETDTLDSTSPPDD